MPKLNMNLPQELSDLIEQESKEMAIPKSTVVKLALKQYFDTKKALEAMKSMEEVKGLMDRVEKLKNQDKED